MKPDTLQQLFDETIVKSLSKENLSQSDLEKSARKLKNAVPRIVDRTSKIVCKTLKKNAPAMLQEHREYFAAFQRRHYRLWKRGLDLLESYLVLAFEIGEAFNNNYRAEAAKTQDYLFEVLTRLHARSVHIGYEVLTLLLSGYADGAHARWRTAHEIATVANFLKSRGQDTAKKYLEHDGIESYKAMLQFQQYASALGYEAYSEKDVEGHRLAYKNLCVKYGKTFFGSYGWASADLGKNNPSIADIEQAAGLDHLRPYYRMASHNVHANPKGVKFHLGLPDTQDILLAGPSNYGLADPAHGVSISILQVTVPLLTMKPNIDNLVMASILERFTDDIGKAFLRTDQSMKKRKKKKV